MINLLLERFYPKIQEPQATNIFRAKFNSGKDVVTVVPEQYLNSSHIPSEVPNSQCEITKYVSLIARMSGNKTGAVIDVMKRILEKNPNAKILWLVPRITLGMNTKSRLEQCVLLFEYYKDFETDEKLDGTMESTGKLIMSIQSLHYLHNTYDYIIVDEIETVLGTFSGDCKTHNGNVKLKENWNKFKTLLKRAKQVIFMDAFYSKLTLNIVNSLIKEEEKIPEVIKDSGDGVISRVHCPVRIKHKIINTSGNH